MRSIAQSGASGDSDVQASMRYDRRAGGSMRRRQVALAVRRLARADGLGVLERSGGAVAHPPPARVTEERAVPGGAGEHVAQARPAQVAPAERRLHQRRGPQRLAYPQPRDPHLRQAVALAQVLGVGVAAQQQPERARVAQVQPHPVPARPDTVPDTRDLDRLHRGGAPAGGEHVHVRDVARRAGSPPPPSGDRHPGGCRRATRYGASRRTRRRGGARGAAGTGARTAHARSARRRPRPPSARRSRDRGTGSAAPRPG